jgi:hypothetical protein
MRIWSGNDDVNGHFLGEGICSDGFVNWYLCNVWHIVNIPALQKNAARSYCCRVLPQLLSDDHSGVSVLPSRQSGFCAIVKNLEVRKGV